MKTKTKERKLFKQIKTILAAPLIAGLIMLPTPSRADDAHARAIIGLYEKGKGPRAGFGLGAGIRVFPGSINGSITISYDGKNIRAEALELAVTSTAVQTTLGELSITGYVYSDEFYAVPLIHPGVGLMAHLDDFRIAVEWLGGKSGDVFIRYNISLVDEIRINPKITLLMLDEKIKGVGIELGVMLRLGSIIISIKGAPMVDPETGELRSCNVLTAIEFGT